jgi:hypothetical protein
MTVIRFQDIVLASYNKHVCCLKTKPLTDMRNADLKENGILGGIDELVVKYCGLIVV